MSKIQVIFALLAALGAGLLFARQSSVNIPVSKTPAYSGKQMYASYCAPCHGLDGRGHGPAAEALKRPPEDLTLLQRNNHGVYPARRVIAVLQFGVEAPAHGSREMPVWGPVFGKLDHPSGRKSTQELRISNLTRYLETLQAR
jgi:mono/diheme cytochrome c family protein